MAGRLKRSRCPDLLDVGDHPDGIWKPFADLDAKWAPSDLASKNFIRVVYHSLADKKSS